MANRFFLLSPTSSANNYLLNNILFQLNEWLFLIPNLFHSLLTAISNFFHSLVSLLSVIPNFFHSLLSAISNCFHSLISWLHIIPECFHSLVSWLHIIPDFFHSLVSWLHIIPDFFHSLISRLSVIPNLFHSLISETTNLFHSLESWLSTTIPNLFHSLFNEITNLFHSLLAKFNAACPAETRAHLLDVATPFVIGGLGVVLLLFICYQCWPVFTWLAIAVSKLISEFFRMLPGMCRNVFKTLCCCTNTAKTMIAPGTNGAVIIVRAAFEQNPAVYFRTLRLS